MHARVVVNRHIPLGVSELSVGVTLTQVTPAETMHGSWEAWDRAARHGSDMPNALYALHMFGFGTSRNVTTSATSAHDWSGIDRRVQWLMTCGAKRIVLTAWEAPDWMLIPGKTKYRIVAEEHEQAYADLIVAALRRYLARSVPIVAINVWNELKGYWVWSEDCDIASYTRMYNKVWDTIRAHKEFDHIAIGGPYLIISLGTELPIPADLQTLEYWHRHAHGADAICIDYAMSHNEDVRSQAEYLQRTVEFGQLVSEIRDRYPALPVRMAEDYIHSNLRSYATLDVPFQAVCTASMLRHQLLAGASETYCWGLQGDGELPYAGIQCSWLADTRAKSGPYPPGGATEIYWTYKLFHDHFGPGTQLYQTESSDPLIEVLASDQATLLINKHDYPIEVWVDGRRVALGRYEVCVL